MNRRKQKRAKSSKRVLDEKNRVRGVIDSVKAPMFEPNSARPEFTFPRELSSVLTQSREKLTGKEAVEFIAWVDHQLRAQVPRLRSTPVDSTLNSSVADRKSKSLVDELAWIIRLIGSRAKEISKFRSLAERVEDAALNGKFSDAKTLTREIETTFGRSIWSVDATIALAQQDGGLEAQKSVTAQVRKADRNGLAAYIAAYLSVRNEPASLLNTFAADTTDRTNRITNPALRDYLRFRLLWDTPFSQNQLANVLLISQGLSIVDLYEAFIDVVQIAIATSLSPELTAFLELAFSELKSIQDYRLSKVALFLGLGHTSLLPARAPQSTELILSGEVFAGLRAAAKELRHDPRAFHTALVTGIALAQADLRVRPGKTLWSEVIREIAQLCHFDEHYLVRLQNLEKSLVNRSFSRAMRACCHELRALLSQDPLEKRKNHVLALLNNPYSDPEEQEHYLSASPESRALNYAPSEIVKTLFDCRKAASLSLTSALKESDDRAEALKFRPAVVYCRRAYISALFESADLLSGLQATATAFFELNIPTALLPLDGAFTALRWKQLKQYSSNIVLPVVLHLCWRQTGGDQVLSNLRYSYDATLAAADVNNPCDLQVSDRLSEQHLVYFLRFVCIPEVIDMSRHVKSSRQTNELRRDICTRLIQLDPENAAEYTIETFSITRNLSLQEGLRVLDSSRVHVDTAAVTSSAMRELESNLSRYRTLLAAGISPSETVEDVLKELNNPGGAAAKFLQIPESDADIVLLDLIITLRQRFLLDPNHGLDSYLSKRVRHHSMSGYLRGAIENENLITARDSLTGKYLTNTHWPDRIEGITQTEHWELQKALSKFSEEFDKELTVLRSEKLRVLGREHPKGLFHIHISAPIYHLIRSVVGAGVPMDIFCNVCYSIFWSSLDPCLSAAKRALESDAYGAISSAFHKLKGSLRTIFKDPKRYASISSAIQASSEDFNRKVHTVAEWFNRPESKISHQTYALDRALDICLEAARHSLKPFTPKIATNVSSSQSITSFGLLHLADIVLTLLGNVRAHAACSGEPEVQLDIAVDALGILTVRMESQIGKKASNAVARARVAAIRKEIEDGSYVEKIRREGNSGLIKLAGMAAGSSHGTIAFDFTGDDRFFVSLKYELPSVVVIGSRGKSA